MKSKPWSYALKLVLAILFIGLSILNFIRIDLHSHSASDTLRPFVVQSAILVLVLFIIHYFINRGSKKLQSNDLILKK